MRNLSILLASCLIVAPALAEPAKPPVATSDGYLKAGQAELKRLIADRPNNRKARNVIIFIGDGMGVSTLTAGRIFEGQQMGLDGESFVVEMDRLPHTALVKTYSHDSQVADSAPTATASGRWSQNEKRRDWRWTRGNRRRLCRNGAFYRAVLVRDGGRQRLCHGGRFDCNHHPCHTCFDLCPCRPTRLGG
jgi:Alkaline phosphatase